MAYSPTARKGKGRGSKRARAATPIYLPGTNKAVGCVSGTCFRKTITGSKHMLRNAQAVAFDCATLDAAERAGASYVLVIDIESGRTYTASIAHVRRYGFPVTRGHGRQIGLPLDYYSIDGRQPVAAQRSAASKNELDDGTAGIPDGGAA